jgi:IMP dehydrogenase
MVDESVQVAAVMSTTLRTISPGASLRAAAQTMREHDVSALLVTGSRIGIVTSTDILDAVAGGTDVEATSVGEAMTAPVETITTDLQLGEAAAMMTNFGIKHLPVVDRDGEPVGMVSSTDLTGVLA